MSGIYVHVTNGVFPMPSIVLEYIRVSMDKIGSNGHCYYVNSKNGWLEGRY